MINSGYRSSDLINMYTPLCSSYVGVILGNNILREVLSSFTGEAEGTIELSKVIFIIGDSINLIPSFSILLLSQISENSSLIVLSGI